MVEGLPLEMPSKIAKHAQKKSLESHLSPLTTARLEPFADSGAVDFIVIYEHHQYRDIYWT